jgi:predicted branched-subunit amino acid permease
MIRFTLFDLLVFFAGSAFPFVATIGIPIALAILVVPAWRRNRIARRWAWGFVAAVAAFGIVGAPYLIYDASKLLASYEHLCMACDRSRSGKPRWLFLNGSLSGMLSGDRNPSAAVSWKFR